MGFNPGFKLLVCLYVMLKLQKLNICPCHLYFATILFVSYS